MVITESEMMSQGEVESLLQDDQQPMNHPLASLGRQSSIYSLTLDEFQHTLCEGGKHFGSMNMDEFLTSIWNAEENQAINTVVTTTATTTTTKSDNPFNDITHMSASEEAKDTGIVRQPSLARQGSLTLPATMCRKTVDEVWSEIHKERQAQQEGDNGNNDDNDTFHNPESAPRQPTFGEMTLEDFLIKAGVVREQCGMSQVLPQQQQQYGLYQNSNNPTVGPSYVTRPIVGMANGGGGGSKGCSYQTMSQGVGVIAEPSGYGGNGKRNGEYPPPTPPPPPVCYGGRVENGGGFGRGPGQSMGIVVPLSPVSSDGMGTSQVDNVGMDMGGLRGRKRIIDGPVEKVVERRQRRMIKNRESAARSRARKQAYTVELEAELNQLKEENAHLKHALADLERERKQQYSEELKMKSQTKAQKAKERLGIMRRSSSCPL